MMLATPIAMSSVHVKIIKRTQCRSIYIIFIVSILIIFSIVFFFVCIGEKPHVCMVCGKGFSTSSSLNTHRRIHSGEKPHQCPVCLKRFTASSNLYYHRMTHIKVSHCLFYGSPTKFGSQIFT